MHRKTRSIECWDDDFADDKGTNIGSNSTASVMIPAHMQQQQPVKDQLLVVKNFASTIGDIEQVLVSIPTVRIMTTIDNDKEDTVLKALDLVAISKQDYTDRFFDTEIGREYLKRTDSQDRDIFKDVRDEGFGEDGENEVNVDLNTVKKLAQRAAELLPKLQQQVA